RGDPCTPDPRPGRPARSHTHHAGSVASPMGRRGVGTPTRAWCAETGDRRPAAATAGATTGSRGDPDDQGFGVWLPPPAGLSSGGPPPGGGVLGFGVWSSFGGPSGWGVWLGWWSVPPGLP